MADDPSTPAGPATAAPPPDAPASVSVALRPQRRTWRRLAWLLTGSAALLVLAALVAGWLAWRSPATLPWLLRQVPGLQAQDVRGTLADGSLQIGRLDWQLPGNAGRLQAWDLTLQARGLVLLPHPGAVAALRLDRLRAQRVQVDRPPADGQPATAPASLALPLDLHVAQLAIDQLQVDALPAITGLRAALSLGDAAGQQHRIDGLALVLETGTADQPAPVSLNGSGSIGTAAPFATDLAVQAGAAPRDALPAWTARLALRGPLDRLQADAALAATASPGQVAPTLQARATLLPFAAWPLGALDLQTQALDLAALSPRLPATRLAGRATLTTRGLNQPAAIDATLDNAAPGAWDAGRLPVRQLQLQASGRPDQPQRVALQRFLLQLGDAAGPAGRITGQGDWAGDRLDLQLQIDALQPARLHGHAAPLRLDGPLALRARGLDGGAGGPVVAVDGSVSGRWLDGGLGDRSAAAPNATSGNTTASAGALPAVQLRLVAEGSPRHLLVTQADAQAGAARARLTGRADAEAGGWRIAAQGALTAFDPRPWWRGPDGSLWRRGPHRLQGDADLRLLWRPAAARDADTLAIDRLLARIDGEARLTLADSLLAGVPLDGELRLQRAPAAGVGAAAAAAQTRLEARLAVAGNRLDLQAQAGGAAASDRWDATLQAPALAALQPLQGLLAELAPQAAVSLAAAWPRAGSVQATAQAQGRWPDARLQGSAQATALAAAGWQLQQASLRWRLGHRPDDALQVDGDVRGLRSAGGQIDRATLAVAGTLAAHRLRIDADSPLRPPAWTEPLLGATGTGSRLRMDADGAWQPGGAGSAGSAGSASSMGNRGSTDRADAKTSTGRQAVAASPGGRADNAPAYRLQGMSLQAGARLAAGNAAPWLSAAGLSAALQFDAAGQPQSVQLAPGRVQLPGTALRWREAGWSASGGGTLVLAADLETIDVAALLGRLQPDLGWSGDLTLGGRIDLRSSGGSLDADLVLERGDGDLAVTDEGGQRQPLGLSDLRMALSAHGGRWQFAQGLVGRRLGSLVGAVALTNPPGQRWPQPGAALQGIVEARVTDLGAWGTWVPPGWRLSGALDTVAQLGGTLAAPRVTGTMRGSGLGVRNVLEGVQLGGGELAVDFTGDAARIGRLSFQGGDGRLDITGGATLGDQPQLSLQVVAERFRVLGRLDRRVVASGRGSVVLGGQRLQVDGDFRIDEGLIDIGRGDAPTLDADVRVLRGGAAAAASQASAPVAAAGAADRGGAQQPDPAQARGAQEGNGQPAPGTQPPAQPPVQVQMLVKVNLGDRLQLRGQGVDTRLRGDVVLSGTPAGRLAVNGTVTTEAGRYAAYGQSLEISRGRFVFSGDPGNPRLDVLAIRPNLDVLVGVVIDGTAHNPRIRLYSEPELPEYDKLSWLVLGRGPEGLGSADTALLQRAAFALLAGQGVGPTDQFLQAIGLTDFSLRQADGDARDTIVSLGRQLSRRWYVGYERGVHATTGTWQLIYRVAQRFTLRARSGSENAVDLIWTWRW